MAAGPERGGGLRIIAGRWRSRKLVVPPVAGLRPTPDRVRETLFNWLAPQLPGSRCLDLFAGSGALAFEALSRGAREAVLVESEPQALAQLRASAALLAATGAHIVAADALGYLAGPVEPFDIAFLDPPYQAGLLAPACEALAGRGWLRAGALVYLETASDQVPVMPAGWHLHRSKQAGQVGYHLVQVQNGAPGP